jgi:hypothetical protein
MALSINGIKSLLTDSKLEDVENFAAYVVRLQKDPKNTWMSSKTDEAMATIFRRVESE